MRSSAVRETVTPAASSRSSSFRRTLSLPRMGVGDEGANGDAAPDGRFERPGNLARGRSEK